MSRRCAQVALRSKPEPMACCAPLARSRCLTTKRRPTWPCFFRSGGIPHVFGSSRTRRDDQRAGVRLLHLIEPLGLSQPTVSHHLKQLVDAGLLEREQRGKWAYFSLTPRPARAARRPRRPHPNPGGVATMNMTRDQLREEVRRKYAEAARAVEEGSGCGCGSGSCCEGEAASAEFGESMYSVEAARRVARGGGARLARLRQPDRGRRAARGRDRARPRLGRRHRRDPLGEARRPDGLAYGLDMTDEMLALARRNAAEAGVDNVNLPQGRDRADPAARGLGRRRHLQLRDQPLGRQGRRCCGDRPRAEAGRTARDLRHRRRGPPYPGGAGGARLATSAASPARSRRASSRPGLEAAGFEHVSVEFTHEVADGMHGAIVKAVKTPRGRCSGERGCCRRS